MFRVFLLLYNPQLSSNITHSLNLNQVNEETCEAQWTDKKKGVHSHYKKRVLMHRARCQLQSSIESRLSLLSFLLVPFRVVPEAHTERRALREAFSSANQDHCSQTETASSRQPRLLFVARWKGSLFLFRNRPFARLGNRRVRLLNSATWVVRQR